MNTGRMCGTSVKYVTSQPFLLFVGIKISSLLSFFKKYFLFKAFSQVILD